jgi:hypothetical protein
MNERMNLEQSTQDELSRENETQKKRKKTQSTLKPSPYDVEKHGDLPSGS